MHVPAAHSDLDERAAGLDQTPGEHAVDAEAVAVALTQLSLLLVVVEGLQERGVHHVFGLDVPALDLLHLGLLALGAPILVLLEEERGALVVPLLAGRTVDVRNGVIRVVEAERRVFVGEGVPLRNERRIDGDEVRKGEVLLALLVADHRSARRDVEPLHGLDAQVHEGGAPLVRAFHGVHRADDRHVLGRLGALHHVLGELDAGGGRVDRLELAAVLLSRLRVEGVDVGGTTAHPQHDDRAGALARGLLGHGLLGQDRMRQRRCRDSGARPQAEPEEAAPVECGRARFTLHVYSPPTFSQLSYLQYTGRSSAGSRIPSYSGLPSKRPRTHCCAPR